jgi:hypothetical protein
MVFSKLRQAFYAALPVVGPHAGIEAQLLLGGVKPIGWLSSYSEDYVPKTEVERKEYEAYKKLDEAVAQGRLKRVDVVCHGKDDLCPSIVPHYYQPDKEQEALQIIEFNRRAFNQNILHSPLPIRAEKILEGEVTYGWLRLYADDFKPSVAHENKNIEDRKLLDAAVGDGKLISEDVVYWPKNSKVGYPVRHYCKPGHEEDMKSAIVSTVGMVSETEDGFAKLPKDVGRYIGYRKRDIWWFYNAPRIADRIFDRVTANQILGALAKVSEKCAKPAYHQKLLDKCKKLHKEP